MTFLFKKKSIITTILVSSLLIGVGCSSAPNKSDNNSNDTKVATEAKNDENTSVGANKSENTNNNNKTAQAASTTSNNGGASKEKTAGANTNTKDKVNADQNIAEKTKNYILNGQANKSEAQKIKWSKTFLDRVNIDSLYKQYKANGGKADDIESFANYITKNAPIQSDWQELFKKDLYNTYGEKVVKLEHLSGDSYQAYVEKNGSQVPYVVVSSRTGYFHG